MLYLPSPSFLWPGRLQLTDMASVGISYEEDLLLPLSQWDDSKFYLELREPLESPLSLFPPRPDRRASCPPKAALPVLSSLPVCPQAHPEHWHVYPGRGPFPRPEVFLSVLPWIMALPSCSVREPAFPNARSVPGSFTAILSVSSFQQHCGWPFALVY